MLGARVELAEEPIGPLWSFVGEVDEQRAVRQPQCRLDGVRHARGVWTPANGLVGGAVLDHQPVDDHVDGVLVLLVEVDLLVEIEQLAIHANSHESRLSSAGKHFLVLALSVPDQRGHDHQACPLWQVVELIDHLLDGLSGDLTPADWAVHAPDPRKQQAQVVVDLGHRPDGRSWVPGGTFLVDADRGAQSVDLVDVRLLHLSQELARVGAQRLDVATLAFRIDRVEGEARFSRSGEAGDHDQPVARHVDVEVLEVVLARTAHGDSVGGHRTYRIRPI